MWSGGRKSWRMKRMFLSRVRRVSLFICTFMDTLAAHYTAECRADGIHQITCRAASACVHGQLCN